jgi:excisionase family DNA binding protein
MSEQIIGKAVYAGLMNAQQAAEALGLKVATLRQWIWLGKIPIVRIGRAVRIEATAIEDLIARGRVPACTRSRRTGT